jgi:hypothetical protein
MRNGESILDANERRKTPMNADKLESAGVIVKGDKKT